MITVPGLAQPAAAGNQATAAADHGTGLLKRRLGQQLPELNAVVSVAILLTIIPAGEAGA
jgi:hypothetical protein